MFPTSIDDIDKLDDKVNEWLKENSSHRNVKLVVESSGTGAGGHISSYGNHLLTYTLIVE